MPTIKEMLEGFIANTDARLSKLESDMATARAKPARAPASEKTALPESAEINTLKGLCKLSAQRTVESHARKGSKALAEYVAKVENYWRDNPDPRVNADAAIKRSPRLAYARALLSAMGTENAVKPRRSRKS